MLSLPMFTNLIKKENRKNNKNMINALFYRYNCNEVLDWNIILTSFQFIVHSILNQNKWSQYPWWLKGFVHKFGIRFSKKNSFQYWLHYTSNGRGPSRETRMHDSFLSFCKRSKWRFSSDIDVRISRRQ